MGTRAVLAKSRNGAVPILESKDMDIFDIPIPKAAKSPKKAAEAAAAELRLLAEMFDRLAETKTPCNEETQRQVEKACRQRGGQ